PGSQRQGTRQQGKDPLRRVLFRGQGVQQFSYVGSVGELLQIVPQGLPAVDDLRLAEVMQSLLGEDQVEPVGEELRGTEQAVADAPRSPGHGTELALIFSIEGDDAVCLS